MGSGALLAALVVLWFVVLVPMVVTRGDARTTRAGVSAGRTLTRRRSIDPVVHAETERVAIDRDQLRATGELRVNVRAVRRRALLGLVGLALLTLAGAVVLRSWLWAPQALLDLAVVGYLFVLRRAARRERLAARRAARAAEREALRAAVERRPAAGARPVAAPASASAPAPRTASAREAVHETVAQEELPHPSLPLAPVRTFRRPRVVAARAAAPKGWQHSAVVGLDDDDIGFADIDVYQPRVVNG
jgi:hypothetical protein